MPLRRLLPCAALALALVPAAPAAADQAVAEIGRAAPVAGYGGWEAWSRFDERHRPLHAHAARPRASGGARTPLSSSIAAVRRLAGSRRPRQRRRVYQRCGSSGCDIRRYEHGHRQRRKLSRPSPRPPTTRPRRPSGARRRLHAARPRLRRPVRQEPELVGVQPPAAEEQVPADRSRPRLDPRQPHRHQLGRHQRRRQQRRGPQDRRAAQVLEQRQRLAGDRQAELRRGVQLLRPGGPGRPLRLHRARRHPPGQHVRARSRGRAASPRRCAPSARSPTRSPSRAPTPRSTSSPRAARRPSCDGFTDVPCRLVRRAGDPVRRRAAHADPAAHGRLRGPAARGPAAALHGHAHPAGGGRQQRGEHDAAGRRLGRALPPHRLEPRALRRHGTEGGHRRRRQLRRSCSPPRPPTPGTPPWPRRPTCRRGPGAGRSAAWRRRARPGGHPPRWRRSRAGRAAGSPRGDARGATWPACSGTRASCASSSAGAGRRRRSPRRARSRWCRPARRSCGSPRCRARAPRR